MPRPDRTAVRHFLDCRRIAFVGVSRNTSDFSRHLFRELRRRGYDLIPVHPHATEIEGVPCAASVRGIDPPPEGALLMCSPDRTDQLVHECAEAGIPRVWLHRGVGRGAVTASAVDFCRRQGLEVVAGECPFMFLPGAGLPHRLHGWFRAWI